MIQREVGQTSVEREIYSAENADSYRPLWNGQNVGLHGVLNSIQITHSRITEGLSKSLSSEDHIVEPSKYGTRCLRCQIWQKWAKQSETSLLKIQKDLVAKQQIFHDVVQELRSKVVHEKQSSKQKENVIHMIKAENEEHIIELKANIQQLVHEIDTLKAYINDQQDKEKRLLQENTTIKKKREKKNSNHQTKMAKLEIPWESGLKIRGKSKFQPSATDCSLLRMRDQGQVTDDHMSMNSQWKNSNNIEQEENERMKLQRKQRQMAFANENLKSYNRVLLEKLNTPKRFGQY